MKNHSAWFIFLMTALCLQGYGQTQVVKGKVYDAKSDFPLFGATIILVNSDPIVGSTTNEDGNFRIEKVPIGRQVFLVKYVGYKTITLPNVLVTVGKEVVLDIKLEESVTSLEEVVVTADTDKDLPLNELAKVSARTFNLEEVTRFSGGRNDIARLATTFAGVSAPDDSRNDIVVRGNSPTGLLWRIEGIPIATTNHFATLGTTGGPVNALNTNLLRTSDFLTGAFPAEYGNANAAVFDVNFRNGNTDKVEFTGQVSAFSGAEMMVEGPLSKANESSFLVSYRYGIAGIAATGTSATPYYQDLSFKVNLGRTKIGKIEVFGFGGNSNIDFLGDEIDETDLFANPSQDAFVENELGLVGLSHTLRIDKTAYLKTVFGASTNYNQFLQDNLIKNGSGQTINSYRATNVFNRENRFTVSSTFNKKFSARFSLRAGIVNEKYDLNLFTSDRDNRSEIPDTDNDGIPDFLITTRDYQDGFNLTQTFAQGEYRFNDDWSITAGIHSQYHGFTEDTSFEPRAAVSWQVNATNRLSLAYGRHAQSIPAPILFLREDVGNNQFELTNSNLEFVTSDHFVLAYDWNIAPSWRLKAETYYQSISNVPVSATPSSYSLLNEGADFVFDEEGSLVNEGTGSNIGLELTLEKFFSNDYYFLATTSIFDSKYKGSDGIERNTAFNNQYVFNALFGKEWKFGKDNRNAWTLDSKFTLAGGNPFTPIDIDATRANSGREVGFENRAFSENIGDYYRWDLKFGVRINSKKRNISHQFFIDLQNLTNRKNEFIQRYNEVTDQINTVEQIGFFPDIMYRIQF
ncbi:TonB-dependent receptor [Roseivirga misakiensis]|uniref:TonB-dependent receptor n=1 Tax=Roseivirga misakiensis TaxID=1563681 RepID=A0A1E5SZ22_9BACT|nr:TonB-dependent receptor [Roseivirga misakiensis]OEK04379.1 TonB-dependent receptor [Roseivirga misakiensis]